MTNQRLAIRALLLTTFGLGLAGAPARAAEGTGDEPHKSFAFHHDGAPGDMEVFDLSRLADGETRELGKGGKRIVATRQGDTVTVRMPGEEGHEARTITCSTGDRCIVMVGGGDGEDEPCKMVFIKKNKDGEVEKEGFVSLMVAGEGREPLLMSLEGHDGVAWTDEPGKHVRILTLGDKTLLRCPEGDTTMTVEKDDNREYRCPRHNLPLKKLEGPAMKKVIVREEIRKKGDR